MPYLQVDLDGKRKWPMVAAGLGISEAQVCKGFLDLWETCWREKSATVSLLYLECLFVVPGQGERVARVLCEFGFLELAPNGYRVCGTDKYLRITEARSAGGKKAAANGNLKRGAQSPSSSREPAGEQLGSSPSSGPALTPNTEHQSPNIKEERSDATPRKPMSQLVEKPDKDPELWQAEDFWAWAQHIRQKGGYVAEAKPTGRRLQDWYRVALMTEGVTVHVLKRAFYAFGQDKHWEKQRYPFGAFMAQWGSFAVKEQHATAV